jgi:hypothetical protein
MEQMDNKIIRDKAIKIGFEIALDEVNECILFNKETNAVMYLDFTSKYFQTPYVIVPRINKGKTDIVYYLFDENILCKLKREETTEWPTLSTNKSTYFINDLEKKEFNNNGNNIRTRIYGLITFKKIIQSEELKSLFGPSNTSLFNNLKLEKSYQR